MSPRPARPLALILLALVAASALVELGTNANYFTYDEYKTHFEKAIGDAKANTNGDVNKYVNAVWDQVTPLLQFVEPPYQLLIFGNHLNPDCLSDKTCGFEFHKIMGLLAPIPYDVHPLERPVPFMLALFTRGYYDRCHQAVPWGNENWRFTYNNVTTKCGGPDGHQRPCANPGKCFVNWQWDY